MRSLGGFFSDTYPDPPEVHRLSDQLVVLGYLFLGGKLHKAFADLSTQPAKARRGFTKRLLVIAVLVQSLLLLFFFFKVMNGNLRNHILTPCTGDIFSV